MEIKVCGLTRLHDAERALYLGADALGFVFDSKSPRYIHPKEVANISLALPHSVRVGVFVDASRTTIQQSIKDSRVNAIQLHGAERLQTALILKDAYPSFRIFKAFRLNSEVDIESEVFEFYQRGFEILIDSPRAGQVADGSQVQRFSRRIPVFLAGGLRTENVSTAVAKVKPKGIDLSSGLEVSPGIKSLEKMEEFFKEVDRMKEGFE